MSKRLPTINENNTLIKDYSSESDNYDNYSSDDMETPLGVSITPISVDSVSKKKTAKYTGSDFKEDYYVNSSDKGTLIHLPINEFFKKEVLKDGLSLNNRLRLAKFALQSELLGLDSEERPIADDLLLTLNEINSTKLIPTSGLGPSFQTTVEDVLSKYDEQLQSLLKNDCCVLL